MASRRISDAPAGQIRRPPATTPEARENQLISLAVDLAEQQLRDGTASSQVMTHYLKMSSSRERLEQEKISYETSLLQARKEQLESQKRVEELYGQALKAMKGYQGIEEDPEPVDDFYDT